ncbi:hypothetical protein Y032_0015g2588 [Ancylostoma ceylanicum]|uniref:Uncharacterized protein n=1 Tax=Ancylostoma ceylanicum TaxID=53326 RepID=A0A016V8G7_9BILA|nr:hypothetical protein Y032_0015g2588 [Ancylostoma ceylanicum]
MKFYSHSSGVRGLLCYLVIKEASAFFMTSVALFNHSIFVEVFHLKRAFMAFVEGSSGESNGNRNPQEIECYFVL